MPDEAAQLKSKIASLEREVESLKDKWNNQQGDGTIAVVGGKTAYIGPTLGKDGNGNTGTLALIAVINGAGYNATFSASLGSPI